jgi:large subunit ribosomal protein L35e
MSKSSGKVKAAQLWSKNKEDLTKQLAELKTELSQLRIQKIVSSGTKLTKMYVDSNPNAPRWGIRDIGSGG